MIIYIAGTDSLADDPLGAMKLSRQAIIDRDRHVFDIAFKKKIPIVMLFGGGYQKSNAAIIADSILNLDKEFGIFKR